MSRNIPKAQRFEDELAQPHTAFTPDEPKMIEQSFVFNEGAGFTFKVDQNGQLTISVKGPALPKFDGPLITMEYINFLADNGVSPLTIEVVHEAAFQAASATIEREALVHALWDNQRKGVM